VQSVLTLIFTLTLLLFTACTPTPSPTKTTKKESQPQDVQIFSSKNLDGHINPQSIEEAFDSLGVTIISNNNMNLPFKKKFHQTTYKVYNLALFMHNELSYKLLEKYPSFGTLTPLSLSIYADKERIHIATLTKHGIARVTQIPEDDPDLERYVELINSALHKAMPQGHYEKKELSSAGENPLQIELTKEVDLSKHSAEEYVEEFEAEFEAEMEPLGFLFPNFLNVKEDLFAPHGNEEYDFYHTYSICKFDVIYKISKEHPEAGAWAPCSFVIYKKKDEKQMHLLFLSVENWITTLNIEDEASKELLYKAQNMMLSVLKKLTK